MNRRTRSLPIARVAAVALALFVMAPARAQPEAATGQPRVNARDHRHGPEPDRSTGDRRPVVRPRRVHVHTDHCRRWVPPRCETITERVWVPPRCERVWVPPVCDVVIDACGHRRSVCIRAGYWNTVHHPGRWETVTRSVHVPGRWETTCGAGERVGRGD